MKEKAVKQENEFIEKVIRINRVAKVVKGGKRFGFSTLVVVGNGNGNIGVAMGKSNDVRSSIEKAMAKAKENMEEIKITDDFTISHTVIGKYGAGRIILKPAGPGTGVIAGGPARAVLTALGVKNILTKCLRSRNPLNVVYATLEGLRSLRTKEEIAESRGKETKEL